jgi:PAS domain S-box-containing protein
VNERGEVRAGGVSAAACLIVILVASLAIAGWMTGTQGLKGLVPGGVSMNPLTALCLLASALAILASPRVSPRARSVCRITGLAVAVVGACKLLAICGLAVPEIDRLLFRARLVTEPIPNQMAPNTAGTFLLLGLSLALEPVRVRRGWRPAHMTLGVVAFIALVTLIGYGYGARAMYEVVGYIPMAANTALCFLALALGGLTAHPGEGLDRLLTSTSPSAHVARWLLPASLLVPLVLWWPRSSEPATTAQGLAWASLVMMVVMAAMVWLTTRRLESSDRERRRIESELRRTLARQNHLFASDLIGIVTIDASGAITEANRGFLELTGFGARDLPLAAERHTAPESLELDQRAWRELRERGATRPWEKEWLRRDGSRVPVIAGAVYVPEHDEFFGFGLDLTARKRVEAELESFSYSVSHDLRAPLRHIAGFSDLLLQTQAAQLDETGRRRLQVIADSAQGMGRLIDDLLAFSRMGRVEMRVERVDLGALVAEVRRDLDSEVSSSCVEWRIAELPEVEGDRSMLRQVFVNLLANAVKYSSTREHAVIEIGARAEPSGDHAIWIRDNGVGFDPRYAAKLFGVFQRLHRADEFPGTGIGLANVRRILDRHGGRIQAESAVDRGATFTVVLPVARAEAAARAA